MTDASPSKAAGEQTRRRLIEAAGRTLRTEGYARTTTRAIAREAGVNPALVFYHFGGVDPLLLAALDESSRERMERHRATVAGARTLEDLAAAAAEIYRTDLEGGHIALFSELVGASIAKPELRSQIVERAQPWIAFIEETLQRVIGGTPLGKLLPPRDLAYAAITFYLGINLFTVLDEDRTRTEALFTLAGRLAPRAKLLTLRLPGAQRQSRRRARSE
jgi:AcrR family transcriptional regulator